LGFLTAIALASTLTLCCLAAQQKEARKLAPPDVKRGKVVFENVCGECHEAYSREEKTGPGLEGVKNGQLPDGRKATHDRLLDIINNGPAEMPALRDRLTEQEKEDVVAFVLTL